MKYLRSVNCENSARTLPSKIRTYYHRWLDYLLLHMLMEIEHLKGEKQDKNHQHSRHESDESSTETVMMKKFRMGLQILKPSTLWK